MEGLGRQAIKVLDVVQNCASVIITGAQLKQKFQSSIYLAKLAQKFLKQFKAKDFARIKHSGKTENVLMMRGVVETGLVNVLKQ